MIGSYPVFETPWATGIFAKVPADGGNFLAGGVRRIKIAQLRRSILKFQIGDPGLHDRTAAPGIESQDSIQSGKANDQALVGNNRTPGQVRPESPRHERNPFTAGRPDNPGHLLTVCRKNDNSRFALGQRSIIGIQFRSRAGYGHVFSADNVIQLALKIIADHYAYPQSIFNIHFPAARG